MDIRITDLLDEYMYDDIPLDQMVTEVRGEPIFDQRKRPTARKRTGQIAAAILIVVSLSAAGMLYFGGGAGEAGGSLNSLEEPVEEEAAVVTEPPNVAYEIIGEEIPQVSEAETEEGFSVVLTISEATVWDMEVTETNISFYVDRATDDNFMIVGGGEQYKLAMVADPDTDFYIIQARMQDGTFYTISGANLTWDEDEEANLFTGTWETVLDPEEISEIQILEGTP